MAAPAAKDRTLDEVKAEVMRRAGHHNPMEGIAPDDAKAVLAEINSLDRDEWAAAWSKLGARLEAKADERAKAGGSGHELKELYMQAFDAFHIGRYPAAATPGQEQAYRRSVRAFRKASKYFEIPLEIVELPFEGKTLVGYLQVPPGVKRPPVAVHWGGVDGWKENRQRHSAIFHKDGIATLTLDMPGTGESPVRYQDPKAESTYTAWLDHLAGRKDVDGSRVAVWGGSFGAYWAARLAYTHASRIKGAVFHGGNIHHGFQREWLVPAFTTGGATYLFGPSSLLEARGKAMGTRTLEEFLAVAPKFSLKDMGLLDKPSAPILGINGKLDDQAPIEDVYILSEYGNPKSSRVYPQGRHMGRTPGLPEMAIWTTITDWMKQQLQR